MKPSIFGSMIAAAVMATAAAAQQPAPHAGRIGYVSTERVLHDSRVAQKVQQQLEAEYQKRDKEIAAGPKDEIEWRRSGLAEDMNARRDEELKQIISRINDIVRRIAVAEKFDVVFLDAIYFNRRIDMTDKVIKELDAGR